MRLRVCVSQGSTFEPRTTLTDEARGANGAAEAGRSGTSMILAEPQTGKESGQDNRLLAVGKICDGWLEAEMSRVVKTIRVNNRCFIKPMGLRNVGGRV